MYNGIGLTSVRGSGTNGHVTKNMAHVSRQRTARAKSIDAEKSAVNQTQLKDPHRHNTEILDHNRKRAVEVKCLQLREGLEEKGLPEDDIDSRVDALRSRLLAQLASASGGSSSSTSAGGRAGETHEDAATKQAESAQLKAALGIKSDYVAGQAFDREAPIWGLMH